MRPTVEGQAVPKAVTAAEFDSAERLIAERIGRPQTVDPDVAAVAERLYDGRTDVNFGRSLVVIKRFSSLMPASASK